MLVLQLCWKDMLDVVTITIKMSSCWSPRRRKCGVAQLKTEIGVSRALDAKAASAFDAESSDLAASIDALTRFTVIYSSAPC